MLNAIRYVTVDSESALPFCQLIERAEGSGAFGHHRPVGRMRFDGYSIIAKLEGTGEPLLFAPIWFVAPERASAR